MCRLHGAKHFYYTVRNFFGPPPATHLLTFLTIASLSQFVKRRLLSLVGVEEGSVCASVFSCIISIVCPAESHFFVPILEGCAKKKRNLGLRKWKKLRKKRPTPKKSCTFRGSYPAQNMVFKAMSLFQLVAESAR